MAGPQQIVVQGGSGVSAPGISNQYGSVNQPALGGLVAPTNLLLNQPGNLSNSNSALRAAYNTLSGAAIAATDILVIGDSITAGQGATSQGYRWINQMINRLRSKANVALTGGVGFLGAYYASITTYTPPTSYTGSTTNDRTKGPGGNTAALTSAGATVTWSNVVGTSVKFLYYGSPGTDTASVPSINSVAQTAINTRHNPALDAQISGSYALAGGNNTIVWTCGSPTSDINGIMVFNGDETTGIRLWDAGHFGYASSDLITSPTVNWIRNINPSVVIIAIGTNDYAGQLSIVQFQNNIVNAIASVRSGLSYNPAILLLAYPMRSDTTNPGILYPSYVSALGQIALSDPDNIAMLDFTGILPSVANSPSGWYYDYVHPGNNVHAMIGRITADALFA